MVTEKAAKDGLAQLHTDSTTRMLKENVAFSFSVTKHFHELLQVSLEAEGDLSTRIHAVGAHGYPTLVNGEESRRTF